MRKLEGYTGAQADMLKMVFDQGKISRAELAQQLGVSNLTVINGIKKLLDDQVLIESGTLPSERGRRVTLLSVNPERFYFLCVDIGSYATKLAVVRFDGSLIHQEQIINAQRNVRKLYITPDILREQLDILLRRYGKERFYALCFCISGTVDYPGKQSRFCVNIKGWNDVDFEQEFGAYFNMPVFLDSSGHCCALAERQFGQGQGIQNLMFVSVGHSICTGIILGGKLLRGASGAAGELGHIQVDEAPPLPESKHRCTCGRNRCLEMHVPIPVIRRSAHRNYRQLDANWTIPDETSDTWLKKAYANAEPPAVQAVEKAARQLGRHVANTANILNPQVIVFGGGTIYAFPKMVDIVREEIANTSLSIISSELTVTATALGADVAIQGAALLAIYNLFKNCTSKAK